LSSRAAPPERCDPAVHIIAATDVRDLWGGEAAIGHSRRTPAILSSNCRESTGRHCIDE
jgi:hypothetical protein